MGKLLQLTNKQMQALFNRGVEKSNYFNIIDSTCFKLQPTPRKNEKIAVNKKSTSYPLPKDYHLIDKRIAD